MDNTAKIGITVCECLNFSGFGGVYFSREHRFFARFDGLKIAPQPAAYRLFGLKNPPP